MSDSIACLAVLKALLKKDLRVAGLRGVFSWGWHRGGFTLIELLVVISVIGILLGLVMPALQQARREAQEVACQGQLHDCGLAFSMYTSDYDGKFMEASEPHFADWLDVVGADAAGEEDLVICPASSRLGAEGDLAVTQCGTRSSAWVLGVGSGVLTVRQGSYGFNIWAYEGNSDEKAMAWGNALVARASDIPILLDSAWVAGRVHDDDRPAAYEGEIPVDDPQNNPDAVRGPDTLYFGINRHNGASSGLFMDWSVRQVPLKEIWRLKWHRQFDTNGPWSSSDADWPDWMSGFRDY